MASIALITTDVKVAWVDGCRKRRVCPSAACVIINLLADEYMVSKEFEKPMEGHVFRPLSELLGTVPALVHVFFNL